MIWTPNDQEIEAVLTLDGAGRYEYLIKKIADQKKLWSLWSKNGWAMGGDQRSPELVPIWPHAKYAALSVTGRWSGYEPKSISLAAWMERWIPGMIRDGLLVAGFSTPNDKGIAVEASRHEQDLKQELSR